MNEDIEVYLDEGGCLLESLIKSRRHLTGTKEILTKLDLVIEAELDLALMAAQKAKSEVLKASAKDKNHLTPIK